VFKGTLTLQWVELKVANRTLDFVLCDALNGYDMNDVACECFALDDHSESNCCCMYAQMRRCPPIWELDGATSDIRICTKKDAFCLAVEADADRKDAPLLRKLEEL